MIKDFFVRRAVVARLESGPLAAHLPLLASTLQEFGYATKTVRRYLRNADRYARWLMKAGVSLTIVVAKGSRRGGSHSGHVGVRGHARSSSTRVTPHHRSQPNRTQRDNWSARGNVNPDTGKRGSKTPTK